MRAIAVINMLVGIAILGWIIFGGYAVVLVDRIRGVTGGASTTTTSTTTVAV